MKLIRVLSRLALLSLAAAAFAGLTGIYGDSVRVALPNPSWQAERRHRPAAPHFSDVPEFVGERYFVDLLRCGWTRRIATAALAFIPQRKTTNFVGPHRKAETAR